MSKHYLFEEPLAIACRQAGLIDGQGRPTMTAHRFRHTVGTQLAEGGARIQTIMAHSAPSQCADVRHLLPR